MKKQIEVPSMGESISEAVIAEILQPSGSYVEENQEIIELETDKVNQPLYAPCNGVVNWSVKEGDTVAIGDQIGTVDADAAPKEAPKKEVQETKPKTEVVKEEKPIPKKTEEKPKEVMIELCGI